MGLFDLFSDNTQKNASSGAVNDTNAWKKEAYGNIDTGTHQGAGFLRRSLPGYNQMYQKNLSGYDMLQNSLGLNGDAGNQAALNAFHTAPGYDFLQQQGEQALMRNNAALGGLASGNTLTGLSKFDTGLANQSYGDWQNRLGQYNPEQPLNDKASVLTNLSNLYSQAGTNKALIAQNAGKDVTDANYASAMSPLTSGANQLNAIMGGLKLAGGLFGMA